MRNKDCSIIISSCDKFSDLWDANVKLLEKNWADRNIKTYIVTDKPTDKKFSNVEILSAGEGTEITERIRFALSVIKTEYIILLLDDYFLTDPINDKKIEDCIGVMEKENLDYLRLYTFINAKYFKEKIGDRGDIFRITTDARYNINLYPCVFAREFLAATLEGTMNAWQYEVSLTKAGNAYGAKCALVNPNALNMLDVVRKGRLIRKAKRYLDKYDLYHGDREVMDVFTTLKLGTAYRLKVILPRGVTSLARKILKKCGKKFYSDEYEN
ncbi:MAG: hypothetical protein IKZ59_08070 [Clostridia bacterium]|nr:hypothetical protein [Clostridia bacterium]